MIEKLAKAKRRTTMFLTTLLWDLIDLVVNGLIAGFASIILGLIGFG